MVRRTLAAAVAVSAVGVANPAAAEPMRLGAPALPPKGFVEFCLRDQTECRATPEDVTLLQPPAALPQPADGWFDWSKVFGTPPAAPPGPTVVAATISTSAVGLGDTAAAPATEVALTAEAAAVDAISGGPEASPAEQLQLDRKTLALLKRVNAAVNRGIARRLDIETYGRSEVWSLPLQTGVTFGDCEDFVLEKRHALLEAGVSPKALSIAVATTASGDTHAVLLVNTTAGEYVLDNLTPWILPWEKVGYVWRERQVAGSPADWAFVAPAREDRARGLMLASLP